MTKNYVDVVNEARRRAYESGIITDDKKEFEANPELWYVEDMQDVVNAFIKDIEEGDIAEDAGPEEFYARHGIKVQ